MRLSTNSQNDVLRGCDRLAPVARYREPWRSRDSSRPRHEFSGGVRRYIPSVESILLRSLWGVAAPLPEAFATFAARGYAGVEATLQDDPPLVKALAADHGFRVSGMVYTAGESVEHHFDSFREQIDRWLEFGATQINAHSAKDAWPIDRSVEFYGRCVEYERTLPIPVTHETHRGRAFFNPWATRDILVQVPGLKLCCDFSHWVCVAERLLGDCEAIIALAAKHCRHLHARVGYEQGPQVPDPGAPEYARHLEAHERWWRLIRDAQTAAGESELTIVPEFGPPAYLHTMPHTNAPVADLDAVVEWMARRLRTSLLVSG